MATATKYRQYPVGTKKRSVVLPELCWDQLSMRAKQNRRTVNNELRVIVEEVLDIPPETPGD